MISENLIGIVVNLNGRESYHYRAVLVLLFPAMNRRELLKTMAAVPLSVTSLNGRKLKCSGIVDSAKKIVIFVDRNAMPPEFVPSQIKGLDTIVIPVDVPSGMSIDQVVRMFQG